MIFLWYKEVRGRQSGRPAAGGQEGGRVQELTRAASALTHHWPEWVTWPQRAAGEAVLSGGPVPCEFGFL